MRLDIAGLREQYLTGATTPSEVIASLYDRIESGPLHPVWIALVPRESALARARAMENDAAAMRKPLYGVPFAIKDNIDLAGLPTTAGCPAYAYSPASSATVVQNLMDAGAIPIGKTNLDQFATGLVGTRSPFGACSSVFDERYISGGSSSGSAVAVAGNLAGFSLGTDTAGSGRVPAAFNNLVGLKPTRGLLSMAGVVPACRTLDCVSIFAHSSADARTVWNAARGLDPEDPYTRSVAPGADAAPWSGGSFRFGVPAPEQLEFFGDQAAAELFQKSIEHLVRIGGEKVEIDFGPFRAAAELLYAGPWVAERLAAIQPFLEARGDEMHPVVREIIAGGRAYTAVKSFQAAYKLQQLHARSAREWSKMDVLVLPTTGTTYTIDEVQQQPIKLNTNLGFYTNFVNLLDLSAIAVPAGFRANGLPFGVSFIARAFQDEALLRLAELYHAVEQATQAGPTTTAPGCISVAVVGAHLSGQPLNKQLLDRGARLVATRFTSPRYRMFDLPNQKPPKPGLVRVDGFEGPGIELEVWAVPENHFGSFVAAIPPPLGIGSVELEDGEQVKCFICEPFAISGARDITRYGGWRNFLAGKLPEE
ncbi:MAG: allophanate hydrolase [Acidobacteriota bacterium]